MAAYSVLLGCFMALLILLYTISSVARYYIKFTFFTIGCLIAATIPMPLMLLKPRHPDNALIPAWGCRQIAKIMGLTWEVRGAENIDNSKGSVVIMNHQSSLDLIVLAILWPLMSQSTVVSKRALFYLWPFGLAVWLWGTVFIDRGQKQQAQNVLSKNVEAIKNRKAKLLLFAEGTRNSGDKLLPFKKGAFHTAIDANCPIQPVVISKYYYLDSKNSQLNSGHFIVTILPQVSTEGVQKENIPELVDKCHSLMQETYTEISREVILSEGSHNLNSLKRNM
ncbi:1-acyl-sn-glycerol-3-phosphate acyltransferase alpha-like [Arctopsyche grandis]|uniref:1-acyl-sn-glycerol-3-phosphate acyltransferase alpha-like n=1 Tax=Arctopsyche grandis TaxID=121162 RepID=UPI00406D9561